MDYDLDALIDQVAEADPLCDPKFDYRPLVVGLVGHIDGDFLAYFAAGGDKMSVGASRSTINSRVERFKKLSGAERVVMHLTCGGSNKGERYLIAQSKPYQGNRKNSKHPANWQFCRDYMTDHAAGLFIPKVWVDREADDGMAYCCNKRSEEGPHLPPILAHDKDMRMFAGVHYNWVTWERTEVPHGAYEVIGADGLLYGHKWFWMQLITGDSADNIQGLPNQGEAKATACLEGTTNNSEAFSAVAALYERRIGEGWQHHLVEQAALLWMRVDARADTLDFLRLGVFPTDIRDAANELRDRVKAQRKTLEDLAR